VKMEVENGVCKHESSARLDPPPRMRSEALCNPQRLSCRALVVSAG